MANQIKLPAIGNVDKKWVYVGVATTAGIVIFAYIRQRNSPDIPEEELPTGDVATDIPLDAYSNDLNTGGYTDPGVGDGSYGTTPSPYYYQAPNTTGLPTTNAEWDLRAIDALSNVGVDSAFASSALGRYLAKLTLTEAQADVVRQAIGMVGNPPQGTFNITITQVTPPPTTNTPTTNTKTPVTPSGLKATKTGQTSVSVDWSPVTNTPIKGYTVFKNGARITTVTYSLYTFAGLKKNTKYKFEVQAIGTNGKIGPKAALTVTTKK